MSELFADGIRQRTVMRPKHSSRVGSDKRTENSPGSSKSAASSISIRRSGNCMHHVGLQGPPKPGLPMVRDELDWEESDVLLFFQRCSPLSRSRTNYVKRVREVQTMKHPRCFVPLCCVYRPRLFVMRHHQDVLVFMASSYRMRHGSDGRGRASCSPYVTYWL